MESNYNFYKLKLQRNALLTAGFHIAKSLVVYIISNYILKF